MALVRDPNTGRLVFVPDSELASLRNQPKSENPILQQAAALAGTSLGVGLLDDVGKGLAAKLKAGAGSIFGPKSTPALSFPAFDTTSKLSLSSQGFSPGVVSTTGASSPLAGAGLQSTPQLAGSLGPGIYSPLGELSPLVATEGAGAGFANLGLGGLGGALQGFGSLGLGPQTGIIAGAAALHEGSKNLARGEVTPIDQFSSDPGGGAGRTQLAITTGGLSEIPTALGINFGSGKGADQQSRDALRGTLRENTDLFEDENTIKLAGGATFDERDVPGGSFNVDFTNPRAGAAVAAVTPLAAIVTEGDPKLMSDFAGIFANAATSKGDVTENIKEFYKNARVGQIRAKVKLGQLLEDGKISQEQHDVGVQTANEILPNEFAELGKKIKAARKQFGDIQGQFFSGFGL